MGPDGYRIVRRPVSDVGAGDDPNPVLGPLFELVQGELGLIEGDDSRLGIASAILDVVQLVVGYAIEGPLGWRRLPLDQDRGRPDRDGRDVAGWTPGDCATLGL